MHDGEQFLEALQRNAKRLYPALRENIDTHAADCFWLLDPLARWTRAAFGADAFDRAARGYARYCLETARLQQDYESTGVFFAGEPAAVQVDVYDDANYMLPYMWGVLLIYACWPSMVRHLPLLRDRFLRQLPQDARILELACGHGVLGLLGAEERPDLHIHGVDISPAAMQFARRLCEVSGHAARVDLELKDALDLREAGEPGRYEGIIAAMLAEHLVAPEALFETIAHHLAPRGRCFFGTALESAQRDHVFEFKSEGQVIAMAERCNLRVAEMISAGVRRPGARFRPRALAAILEHR